MVYSILAHPMVSVFCQFSPTKRLAGVAALTTGIEEMLYVRGSGGVGVYTLSLTPVVSAFD